MVFNAKWDFENLAQCLNKTTQVLLIECKRDFAEMVLNCPVFRLTVSNNGNNFLLLDKDSKECNPPSVIGLYSIFTKNSVIYFGEADNLHRRQLKDADDTANSSKIFNNQRRAILKLVLNNKWDNIFGLDPVFMQLYPCNYKPSQQASRSFDECYNFKKYCKALEGAVGLFASEYHHSMILRAQADGFQM